jgi:predicted acylesterase/phospholipase RssA
MIGALALAMLAASCTALPRDGVPEELHSEATVSGYRDIRLNVDTPEDEMRARARSTLAQLKRNGHKGDLNILSLSGGGGNGAFGAGLLIGWTKSGNRPRFEAVTGISVGALIAPLAFLGPAYDPQLEQVFTTLSKKDIITKKVVSGALFGNSLGRSGPLFDRIREFTTPQMVEAIAIEHGKGRRLMIGTTNLDSGKPVVWNIGAIAASKNPGKVDLIRKVMLASASIPIAFPPVEIPVQAGGKNYSELHVDGGVSTQVFSYPASTPVARLAREAGLSGSARMYVINNSRVWRPYTNTANSLIGIAGSSVSALIRTQGIGDIYRIYVTAQRDGVGLRLISIPGSFTLRSEKPFDTDYMRALFAVGVEMGATQIPWRSKPPGL